MPQGHQLLDPPMPALRLSPPAAVRSHAGESKAHHYVSPHFKSRDSKYSGSDEDILSDFMDYYMATAEDYLLYATDKHQLFHNFFRGDTLRFCTRQLKRKYSTFAEAANTIFEHINLADVHQRVKADLTSLSLAKLSNRH